MEGERDVLRRDISALEADGGGTGCAAADAAIPAWTPDVLAVRR